MKVAILYDRVSKWGGAERILLALHKLFPEASLYTSVYHAQKAPWAKEFTVKTSFLQHAPAARVWHEAYALFMPIAFENFSFDEYDLVISVTSEAAKGIITKPKTLHICYCLTPTRYLWSGYNEYFRSQLIQKMTRPLVSYLQTWDRVAAQRPDAYIAISSEVKKRIKTYYGRESTVVYPPVALASSDRRLVNSSEKITKRYTLNANDYFLVVSRLVPYKRIDIAINACNVLQLPLKIVGMGSQDGMLRRIAGPTIEFVGSLTDYELVEYYKACRALIFPGNEDFGLVMVEAQKFGKPVIAFKNGGALEIIADAKTGAFFYPQTTEALIKALNVFEEEAFSIEACIKNAERFSFLEFKKSFMHALEKAQEQYFR